MQTVPVGIKPRPTSDPNDATPHEAGTAVTVLHHVEHPSYGTVGVPKIRYWIQHINVALAAIDDLERLHVGVLAAEVRGGIRVVSDDDLLSRLYRSGVECVLNSILAVQYLSEEMEQLTGRPAYEGPLRERLVEAARTAKLSDVVRATGYDQFIQLSSIRDAIEHPKPSTTFANIYEWDRVPFAWMLGGALQRTFSGFEPWFRRLTDDWAHYLASLPREAMTFTDVIRGAGSGRSFKKPPTA
jgi:hypothetical protein